MLGSWTQDLDAPQPPKRIGPLWFLGAVCLGQFEWFRRWYGGRWECWEVQTAKAATVWCPRGYDDPVVPTDAPSHHRFQTGVLYAGRFMVLYDVHGARLTIVRQRQPEGVLRGVLALLVEWRAVLLFLAVVAMTAGVLLAIQEETPKTKGLPCARGRKGEVMTTSYGAFRCDGTVWRYEDVEE